MTTATRRSAIDLIGWIGLAAILLALLLGRLAFWLPELDWLAHFPAVYLLAAAAVTLTLAVARRWIPAAAGLIVTTLCGWVLIGPFIGRPAQATHQTPNLTLATINVNIATPDPDRIADLLPEADIVALLETGPHWRGTLDRLRSRFPHQWRSLRDTPLGMSVLSRHEVIAADWFLLSPGEIPAMHLRLDVAGTTVDVLIIHTMSPQSPSMLHARDAQLLALQARLDGLSQTAILIGDLNATPWTHSLSRLMEATGLSTSRAGSGLLNSPEGTWPSRFPWFLRIPIDHCLIRGNLQVVSDRLIPIPDSDHLGLVVSVRVGG